MSKYTDRMDALIEVLDDAAASIKQAQYDLGLQEADAVTVPWTVLSARRRSPVACSIFESTVRDAESFTESEKRFPIMIIAFAFIFNSLNGYANGVFLASAPPFPVGAFWPGFRACIGIALFAGGFVTHVWADRDLRRLRAPGEVGYKIPRGGLFNLVSSPNYFGEIAEWCGWALAAWSVPGLGFALFTIANLVPRAHANRAWYILRFPEYPRERKRVFPFIY